MRCKACDRNLPFIYYRKLPTGEHKLEDMCTRCIQKSKSYVYEEPLQEDQIKALYTTTTQDQET